MISSPLRTATVCFTASLLVGTALPVRAAAPASPRIDATFTPHVGASGKADGVEVRYVAQGWTPGKPLDLQWDLLAPSPGRSTDDVRALVVRDRRGVLALHSTTDAAAGVRHYVSNRAPVGAVTVQYRVPVAMAIPPKGRGPHREMQAAGNGITTSGDGFLLLPAWKGTITLQAHWNLPKTFSASSSFGDGDFTATRDIADILDAFYVAGTLRRFPGPDGAQGFNAAGLGQTDIDLQALFRWSAQEYDIVRQAFGGAKGHSFRAFYRSYDGGRPDSGRANGDGILLYLMPRHTEADAMFDKKALMAHEIVHVWQPRMAEEDGEDTLWFTEGSANYYAATLPFEHGLMTAAEYATLINQYGMEYYGNALRNIRNADIPNKMWSAPDAWTIPYDRGALYFADLDARVRSHSGGKTTLLDLFKAFAALRKASKPYGPKAWRALVEAEAGPEAAAAFDAMLAGETILPAPGAFGPCVQGRPLQIGVFDLNYRKKKGTNVIETVLPGSNAEKAGLQVGDVLAGNADLEPAFTDLDRVVAIPIQRNGVNMMIRYVPRHGSVEAMRWEPVNTPECTARSAPNGAQ